MSNYFSDVISKTLKNERDKETFGGEVYKSSYKFPSIIINHGNYEEYSNYLMAITKICDGMGPDITILFAEICNLYNMLDEEANQKNSHIIEGCLHALAYISLCLEQSNDTLKYIEKTIGKGDVILDGSKYCFIVLGLNSLLDTYAMLLKLLKNKNYFNIQFIDSIRERLMFIISPEFEQLRRAFKVVESYNTLEEKPIFH